jgi:hypothetical protein
VKRPKKHEIDAIVNAYRGWRAYDADNAPSAEAKARLKALRAAAEKMRAALGRLDRHANRHFARRLGAASLTDGNVAVLTLAKALDAAVQAGSEATKNIPTSSMKSGERMLGDSLRRLFEHYGIPFTATYDALGNQSVAVRAMVKIARRAGDRSLNPETARQWIRKAKRGRAKDPVPTQEMLDSWARAAQTRGLWAGEAAEEPSRETVEQKPGAGFPM